MLSEEVDQKNSTTLKSAFKEHPKLTNVMMQLNSVQINTGYKVEQIME